jgi:hypothetical protein
LLTIEYFSSGLLFASLRQASRPAFSIFLDAKDEAANQNTRRHAMIKQGIATFLAIPLLGSSLAFAQGAMEYEGKDPSAWRQHFCTERYARKAAHFAYLEAKLNLTEQQKPAWAKWRQAKMDAAEKRRATCLQRDWNKDEQETVLDREARVEKWLTARLQELQASRPALQALYDSLSPEQKVVFDQASRWRGHHRGGEGPHWRWQGFHHEGHENPGQE